MLDANALRLRVPLHPFGSDLSRNILTVTVTLILTLAAPHGCRSMNAKRLRTRRSHNI
jgi:hypothetical protein